MDRRRGADNRAREHDLAMANKPKGAGWGGSRKGSGRKQVHISTDSQIKAMHRAARKRAKEEGKTIDEVLVAIIYEPETTTKDRLAAIKLFKEFTMPKRTESDVKVNKSEEPRLMYPEKKPDPAKVVAINGGKA